MAGRARGQCVTVLLCTISTGRCSKRSPAHVGSDRQIGIWRADFHRTLAPRIYEGGARRARGVPHPDAEKFLFEAVCPDFGLKQLPGWVGSSPPSVRTGVLRIMVRLPPAIVYYRFAARSTTPRKRGEQGLRPVSLSNTNLSITIKRMLLECWPLENGNASRKWICFREARFTDNCPAPDRPGELFLPWVRQSVCPGK